MTLADWDNTLVAAVRSGTADRSWLPAMGNSDAHRDPDPVGTPQTVVLADDLTREAIQEGLRAGRSYVAESKLVSLTFSAAGAKGEHAGIGERLRVAPTPRSPSVWRPPAPPLHGPLRHRPGRPLHERPLPVSGSGTVEWSTTAQYAAYVRAELRHETAAGPVPGRWRRSPTRFSSGPESAGVTCSSGR